MYFRDVKGCIFLQFELVWFWELVLQAPDVLHAILLRLRQKEFDGEMSMCFEVVFPSKVSIKTISPDCRAPIKA